MFKKRSYHIVEHGNNRTLGLGWQVSCFLYLKGVTKAIYTCESVTRAEEIGKYWVKYGGDMEKVWK